MPERTPHEPGVQEESVLAPDRLVSGPFLSVMLTALVFFFYIGMVVVTVPSFIERELDGGEFGVGLTVATFAGTAILVRPFLGRMIERFGRRAVMTTGTALASAATFAMAAATSLWQVLILRGLTGIGEAALFVAAATLVADLSPPDRRAEAASYFSVAVFGGMGVGPALAEWVIGDAENYSRAFVVAALFAAASSLTVWGVPARVDRSVTQPEGERVALFHRDALWPGLVLASGIAAFAVFMAFIPEYSKTVGLAGAGGLFLLYSIVSITLRLAAAKLPERLGVHRTVTIALVTVASGLTLVAAIPEVAALWLGVGLIGVGMAFLYPSLMANVVNRASDTERASALSSLTMFFEAGSIVGGVALGAIGEIYSKRAGFAGGAVVAAFGLVLLWRNVVAAPSPATDPAAQASKKTAFAKP